MATVGRAAHFIWQSSHSETILSFSSNDRFFCVFTDHLHVFFFFQVQMLSQHPVSEMNCMLEPFNDDSCCRMVVVMYQPCFLRHPDVIYVVPQLKFALGSLNVASQLPALQNIWPSAWCLVLQTSSDPKSVLRTRCKKSLLLSCPLPSAFLCSLSFLFWKSPSIINLPSNCLRNWKMILFKSAWLAFWFFSVVFLRRKFRVCSFVCKEEFSCRLASTPCVFVPQVVEQCEEQCRTGIKHSAG